MAEETKTFDIFDKDSKALATDKPSPINIDGLTPNTKYSGLTIAYHGKKEREPIADQTTTDVKPGAPTVQVTADDTKLFVKIATGSNTGSAIKSGKIYYTDGTNAKTMDLMPDKPGTISGLTNGTEYQVQATVTNNAGESAKTVVVKGTPKTPVVHVTDVKFANTTAEVEVGKTVSRTASVNPSNATDKSGTYTSDHPEFATVDQNGKITGVKGGTATITFTSKDGSKTDTCVVTVTDPAPTEPEPTEPPSEGE